MEIKVAVVEPLARKAESAAKKMEGRSGRRTGFQQVLEEKFEGHLTGKGHMSEYINGTRLRKIAL